MTEACDCQNTITRRAMLGLTAATGALVATESLSTRVAFASGTLSGDVLVVVSLRGGFDGLSAVAPVNDAAYRLARPSIGLPASAAIQLDATFGMHPALAPLVPYWEAGSFAVVHAVGQSNPTRSHFEAMEEMERAAPGSSTRTGWLDRVLGLSSSVGSLEAVAMGAEPMPQSLRGPRPVMSAWDLQSFKLGWLSSANRARQDRWAKAMRQLQSGPPTPITTPARAALSALGTIRKVEDAQPPGPGYPSTSLGSGLRDVARLIKAKVGVQLVCIDSGDWDMHADLGSVDRGWMHGQLGDLASALAAFAADLGPAMGHVTVLTMSEFGRRVHENGSGGLDHGHGNAMFLLGGGVVGGRVHGAWPGLPGAGAMTTDLAATTDYRSVLSEVLVARCGVTRPSAVFPGFRAAPLGVVRSRTT